MSLPTRTRTDGQPDRCPGVLRPHLAADGAMVRIRIPGGQTTGSALAELGRVAGTYGSGLLQLTSRAGVQIRGLPSVLPDEVEHEIGAAGFLPSASHERVRNIVASPLTGLHGGRADLRPLVAALDSGVTDDPVLSGLPGRFLFGLDDGRGDVAGLGPDLGYRALDPDHGVVTAGPRHGVPVAVSDAVGTLVDLARSFLRDHPGTWRVQDRPDWPERIGLTAVAAAPTGYAQPLGAVAGHASVGVPLGYLTPDQLRVVVRLVGEGPVVVTPWRGLVLPGAADQLPALVAVGLVADARSPWTALSACVGAPWCASGRVDTQQLVASVVGQDVRWPRTHVSGCERRCGAPAGPHVDLVAPTRSALLSVAEVPAHA